MSEKRGAVEIAKEAMEGHGYAISIEEQRHLAQAVIEAESALRMCDEVARGTNQNLMMIVTSGWLTKFSGEETKSEGDG